jgi:putative SOS response-associated peptidase YedK
LLRPAVGPPKIMGKEASPMCGRFTLASRPEDLADLFGLGALPDFPPRYNVAPTQSVLTVRRGDGKPREPAWARWGLIPSWSAGPGPAPVINARVESVADKPVFRTAFARRRCLVAADGFFEWRPLKGRQIPYHFRRKDGRAFAFAGLGERWQRPGGPAVESCAVLTTVADEVVRRVHERMPVILDGRHFDAWLDPALTDPEKLLDLLRSNVAPELVARPVSLTVNNVRNDGPACVAALPHPDGGLFGSIGAMLV